MSSQHVAIVGRERIEFSLERSSRRTLSISVAPDGAVRVRAPYLVATGTVIRTVEGRAPWIARKRAEFANRPPSPQIATPDARQLAEARRLLAQRLEGCWAIFARPGEKMPPLRVRTMRTRWGSLSPDGRMCLNAHLVRVSSACADYVVFHELCHLRVRGHGADFYREVAEYVPDWKARRRELRDVML